MYVRTLLRLRRENPALAGGRLWHLASDESSYVFVRESDEERIMVAFNNSAQARELRLPLKDTPAQNSQGVSLLFGEARANFSGREVLINAPAQSLSIFVLN